MYDEELNDDFEYYNVTVSIHDVNLLHHCITKRIEQWEGSPSRPAEEQEHLWYLRDSFYRIVLEHKFKYMDID
jgi:hypothetical protein